MLTEEPWYMEGKERTLAGDGDVPDREGAAGVLDDAVAGAANWVETVRVWTGDEDLNGMGMVHDAVDGDILRKRNEFVSDLSGYSYLTLNLLWRNNNSKKSAVMAKKITNRRNTTKQRTFSKEGTNLQHLKQHI